MIQHNIKTKYLETHVVCKVLRMDIWNRCTQSRIACDYSFDYNIVNSLFKGFYILSLILNVFKDRSQRPFMPDIHVFHRLIKNKLRIIFVDCIVSKMHVFIVKILWTRRSVFFSSKSCQALLVDKNS